MASTYITKWFEVSENKGDQTINFGDYCPINILALLPDFKNTNPDENGHGEIFAHGMEWVRDGKNQYGTICRPY